MKKKQQKELTNKVAKFLDALVPDDCTYCVQFFGPKRNQYWFGISNDEPGRTDPSVIRFIQQLQDAAEEK